MYEIKYIHDWVYTYYCRILKIFNKQIMEREIKHSGYFVNNSGISSGI